MSNRSLESHVPTQRWRARDVALLLQGFVLKVAGMFSHVVTSVSISSVPSPSTVALLNELQLELRFHERRSPGPAGTPPVVRGRCCDRQAFAVCSSSWQRSDGGCSRRRIGRLCERLPSGPAAGWQKRRRARVCGPSTRNLLRRLLQRHRGQQGLYRIAWRRMSSSCAGDTVSQQPKGVHMSEEQLLQGSCHCGAVRPHVPSLPEKATQCNCSICRRSADFGPITSSDGPDRRTPGAHGRVRLGRQDAA
jgi:hypothetical protein